MSGQLEGQKWRRELLDSEERKWGRKLLESEEHGGGATRSSGGIEKAEDSGPGDSLEGESGFGQAGHLGAMVSIIWAGEQVVQRVGREHSVQKACT